MSKGDYDITDRGGEAHSDPMFVEVGELSDSVSSWCFSTRAMESRKVLRLISDLTHQSIVIIENAFQRHRAGCLSRCSVSL
jgi:hypothetical protein